MNKQIFKPNLRTLLIILLMQVFVLSGFVPSVLAGGLDRFLKFSGGGGTMTSINKGAVINDQKAGYMTGGSIISRGPRPMELQPLSIELPSAELDGCTGSFNLRWGGFSHIKGPEFVKYYKAVAASSGTYVAKMAITQVCTICDTIMSYLETVARDVNGTTFSQCEQGKALAEGLMSKFNSASQQKCKAKSSLVKGAEDLVESTQKCQDNPDIYGNAGDEDALKSMLPDNYNLVWRALSHGNGGPKEMKELIMSISGSILGKKIKGTASTSTLPSLVEKDDLLEQYIGKPGAGSSQVKLYVCDEEKNCLNPVVTEKTLSNREDTLYGKIEATLGSILDKIAANAGELTDEEKALIEYSQIPIISLFEIELALKNKESVATFAGDSEFIEVVCYDMVTNFMQKMLNEAKTSVDTIKTAQLDNTPIDRFNKNVENVQLLLRDKKYEAMNKLKTIVSVKERLSAQQNVFRLGFSRFVDTRSQ